MANSYLSFTQAAGTSRRKFTYSVWMKRSTIDTTGSYNSGFFNCWSDANNRLASYFYDNKLFLYGLSGGSANIAVRTNRLFRDTSAWYHIVIAVDTTQGTASDRIKFYVNGVQETSFDQTTYPAQDHDLPSVGVNAKAIEVGRVNFGDQSTYYYMDGNLSHVAFVDGTALTPTSFGETDSTSGIWKFKSPSGVTWGTNGFHLKFENSGAMGTDSSGNSNTFTVNGDLKQALDTPSNVYCTINPLYRMDLSNNATMSNGNTTFSSDQSGYNIRYGTLGVNKGKWYYEAKFISHNPQTSPGMPFGISGSQIPAGQQNAGYAQYDYSYNYDGSNGTVQANNTATNYGTLPLNTIGQIGMCAFDLDNNKLYFGVNGVWANSGNPGGNANGFTIADPDNTELGFYFPSTADRSSNRSYVYSFNFGNGFFGTTAITSAGSNGNGSLFEYDCPTGYYALNTKNINTYG